MVALICANILAVDSELVELIPVLRLETLDSPTLDDDGVTELPEVYAGITLAKDEELPAPSDAIVAESELLSADNELLLKVEDEDDPVELDFGMTGGEALVAMAVTVEDSVCVSDSAMNELLPFTQLGQSGTALVTSLTTTFPPWPLPAPVGRSTWRSAGSAYWSAGSSSAELRGSMESSQSNWHP